MKKSSRTIRHLQSRRDQRLTSTGRRLNQMAKDRWRQLLRNQIVRTVIEGFKVLMSWMRPKTVTQEPTPTAPASAMAA